MADPTLVRESFALAPSSPVVDESGPYPVIRGVSLCGLTSEHGYEYLPTAWTDADIKRYDGLPSYEGHADGTRKPSEKVGWFENSRRRPSGQPEADYFLEPDHPMTPRLIRAAKNNPKLFALSHTAHVRWGERSGRRVVEGFRSIHSVDVVDRGGTNGGIFESAPGGTAVKVKISDYANRLAPKLTIEQLVKLKTLVKEEGGSDMPADAPAPDAAGTGGQDGVDAAFLAAGMAALKECMDTPGDRAKVKACAKRLVKLLMAHGDIKGEPEEVTEEPAKKEEPKPEPTKEAAPVDHSAAIADEIVREGFAPSATQLKALRGMPLPADRVAFIREQKGLSKATAPASASRESVSLVTEGAPAAESEVEQARKKMAALARQNQGLKPSKN
ncbi:Uncharacterized protein OS=Planctomyces brasiliensis (strain ATCC 49424 / DSM 5305 / JCM 21570 / NBRC 103401 / IFAM 1448) GN=Plabr_0221 PE=4 SV=1 [Gemmataceae bacterium]|nr:Uncharacterized protein OS=Planctomyces brasiliensis (strain ATCC 49424 / DSM 5305 / JCM 21570 / NBRC 103401 / IFAM 1448) GN=Plabr_0221 PE=4 SV=1 [Gemmataceae bacterium]VTT98931.1 Uncharacterized protein OS=Planctomyces brasiliensis (strain ATCC 49424 / DSM 5305 / JCM 21570 / NBRC 103401 / IFAM 1448) GN=Plabr_0221 PE=4 SV=1 [Gemmataceae bacterium]